MLIAIGDKAMNKMNNRHIEFRVGLGTICSKKSYYAMLIPYDESFM